MTIKSIEIDLDELINKSIYIIREALTQFKNPAMLWSTGKDSTAMMYLVKMASPDNKIHLPIIHLDTNCKFPEIYEYRDRLAKEWGFKLIIGKNEEAIGEGITPEKVGHFNCCNTLKTEALKIILRKYKFDALILSIRHDEHYMRNLERIFSPRDKEFNWHIVRPKTKEEMREGDAPFVSEQQVELWDLWQTDFGENINHVRVHPILMWTELDVWRFMKKYNIPFNPLYRADYVGQKFGYKKRCLNKEFEIKNGKFKECPEYNKEVNDENILKCHKCGTELIGKRFRSLGCQPCTVPVDSNASTIDEIIEELKTTDVTERSGRSQDKEKEQVMRRLRSMGYP